MRGKILESFYDAELGYSEVTKHTKYGTFTDVAYCHEDDKDIMNEWDGCRFAEFKCDMQALHEKIKMMKQRLVGMDQLIDLLDRPQVSEEITCDASGCHAGRRNDSAQRCGCGDSCHFTDHCE